MARERAFGWLAALALVCGASGCDFFQELESAESAGETGDTGDTGGTDGFDTDGETDGETDGSDGPCTYVDDFCSTQDQLHSCDPDSGEVTDYNCAGVCGGLLNFTCMEYFGGRHACWCVEPGLQNVNSCSELEACLATCADAGGLCGDQCFSRSTASTIRMYGSLIHCSEASCKAVCDEAPEACADCVLATKSGLYGDCVAERALCDSDSNDEFPFP